jgi:hypothetical protein
MQLRKLIDAAVGLAKAEGEPHYACLGLDSGDGLLRVEPNHVHTRGLADVASRSF